MRHFTRTSLIAATVLLAPIAVAAWLACSATADETTGVPTETVSAPSLGLEALEADIAVLGSINQLDLTKQQAASLLEVTEQLHAASARFEKERQGFQEQLRPLLERKRALMMKDQAVPDELEKDIAGVQAQLEALDRKVVEALVPFAEKFRPILSAPQLQIVTGDYEARRQAEEWLDSLREMSPESFKDEMRPIVQEFADATIGLDQKTLTTLFTEAHNMDSKTWAKKKGDYVKRIAPLFRPAKGKDSQLIVQFFMHPRMVPVLQDKAEVLK
jgi:hypothetical protein